jgi:hypothetical protein
VGAAEPIAGAADRAVTGESSANAALAITNAAAIRLFTHFLLPWRAARSWHSKHVGVNL